MISKAKEILDSLDIEGFSEEKSDLESKIKELNEKGDFSSDEYINATQNLSKITETISLHKEITENLKSYSDSKELSKDSDEEMAQMAKEEMSQIKESLKEKVEKLEALSAKPLKNDDKKAIVEFRPGVGGIEASLFAEDLFRIYVRYFNSLGFRVENLSLEHDNEGGIKEATVLLDTNGAFGEIRFESGVHRVQRIPVTESGGRIHTSTASVVIMPKIEPKDVKIRDEDLKIDVFRSSGPGGQSVNTTDSAVRITHLPSGITVSCQNGKSQHKNKEMAFTILLAKLSEIEEEKRTKEEKELRNASILGGDRSAKIRTYNFQQSRVTDHRINESWFNIDQIMEGEIDEIVKTVNLELRKRVEN